MSKRPFKGFGPPPPSTPEPHPLCMPPADVIGKCVCKVSTYIKLKDIYQLDSLALKYTNKYGYQAMLALMCGGLGEVSPQHRAWFEAQEFQHMPSDIFNPKDPDNYLIADPDTILDLVYDQDPTIHFR